MEKKSFFLSILFVAFLVFLLVILFQPQAYADEDGTRAGEKFVGSDACRICHIVSYDGWNSTRHPNAWNTLTNDSGYTEACEVCHVTGYGHTLQDGFDPASNLPVVMRGIQCEACHGPGEDHFAAPLNNPLEFSLSAYVCGATCHNEEHHPYFEEWSQSGHAQSLLGLKGASGAAEESCLICHSVEEYFDNTTTLDTAQYSITCSRCHDPHNSDNPNQLRLPADELCAGCHHPSAALPGDPIYHPQSSMRDGRSGAPILGESFMPDVTCADCHVYMNKQTNVTGHSFTPKAEACVECHTGTPPFYSNDTAQVQITEWKTQTWTKIIDVQASIVLAKIAIEDSPNFGFSDNTIQRANDLHQEANYSFTFVVADGSGGSHNPLYAQQLLGFAENRSNEIIDLLTHGTVTGRVLDESGNPVEGVMIVVDGLTMATTSSVGSFSFDFAPGTHSLNFKLKGDLVGSVDSVLIVSKATTDVGDVTITDESLFVPLMMAVLVIVLLVALVVFMFFRMQKIAPKKPEEDPGPEEEDET